MDILLLVTTIVSLSISLFLGFAAWGMWREERARSAARVAALSAAADRDSPAAEASPRAAEMPPRSEPLFRTEPSFRTELPLRAEPSLQNEPPFQSEAAVHVSPARQPLRRPAPWSAPATPAIREQRVVRAAPVPADSVGERFLGSAIAPAQAGRQRGLAIAAALLFIALSAGAYFTFSGGSTATPTMAAAASGAPLELISLRHERRDGALAITGLVRNPQAGQSVAQLAAVAFLFNQQGEFVTSSKAGVDFTQLAPGDESPFVIRIDAPSNVARYRVSFRTESGVVPHIDRRGQEPIARELP
jgi:hypothetical protein